MLMIPARIRAIGLGLATVLTLAAVPSPAQEPASAKSSTVKRANDPSRRVPDFFGQIGLTPEQRETIYKIRGKHQTRIDELEKQIAELQSQMLGECEGVLTDTQKELLTQRRKAADTAKKKEGPEKVSKSQVKSGS
jgi:uncharacterized coiled-coil protein SlyX